MPPNPSEPANQPDFGILHLEIMDGRSSGVLPLRFAQDEHGLVLVAGGDPRPRWVDRILLSSNVPVRWRLPGGEFIGVASVLTDTETLAGIRARFVARFGEVQVRDWFGDALCGLALRAARELSDDYASLVRASFDALAENYDTIVSSNDFDAQMREATLGILARSFRPGDRVLEVGAGTGLETLAVARRGVHVVATDISERMLARLSEKASTAGIGHRVLTRQIQARDLARLQDDFGARPFDGAFSDFGALNCEPDLHAIPEALANLLRSGAPVVLTVWNRACLAEAIAYLAAGKPNRAFARFRDPVPVGLSRFGIPVYARSAGEIVRLFRSYFEFRGVTGLPVFLPPYDLAARLTGRETFLSLAQALDRRFAGKAPFNRLGDHFILELRRR